MGIVPSADVPASDEVIDAIAGIELKRRELEKEAGLAMSCNSALRGLHELLEREAAAQQPHGAGSGHPQNIHLLALEIERVKALAVVTRPGPAGKNSYPDPRKASWRDAHRNPARNKGRRTMGRAGGR